MPLWIWPALALAIGYLLGSIPFGLLIAKLGGAGDIRTIGSGNIGATNVLRTGRKGLAAATLIFDIAKGAAGVCIARAISPELTLLGGVGAFIGHVFPVWLKFRGGKGVATMLGISLATLWPVGLAFAAAWLVSLAVTRISSVSGMLASVVAPATALMFGDYPAAAMLAALALIVLWKHADNIARLIDGEEPKVGRRAE